MGSVTVTPASPAVNVAQLVQLRATLYGRSGANVNRPISWTSSDTSKATVSDGMVFPLASSAVTVRATSEGVVGSTVLTITLPAVASGTLPLATPVADLAYDTRRNILYLSQPDSQRVAVVRLSTLTYDAPIALTSRPAGLDVTAEDTLLVALPDSGAVALVGLANQSTALVRIKNTSVYSIAVDAVMATANRRAVISVRPNQLTGLGTRLGVINLDQRTDAENDPDLSGFPLVALARSADHQRVLAMLLGACCPARGAVYSSRSGVFSAFSNTVSSYGASGSADRFGSRMLINGTLFSGSLAVLADRSPSGYQGGPSVIAADGRTGYFAVDNTVVPVNLDTGASGSSIALTSPPTRLFVLPTGAALIALTATDLTVVPLP
ncbi:MAG: hypothetical protein A2085_07995 [Gemmatimonadetes bacterium GWC2_71_10]|nr:MAG: hypothetical protein A2085_07995 [Gemmatimonadetes bacterium GWC2_71_10]